MITIVKGAVKIIDLSQNGCETYPARTMKISDCIGAWNLNIICDLLFGAWNLINPEAKLALSILVDVSRAISGFISIQD